MRRRLATTLILLGLAATPVTTASATTSRAAALSRGVAWLERQQSARGCVGDWSSSSWAAIGLRAAGQSQAARRAAACAAASLRLVRATDQALAILGAVAGGFSPRSFGRRNLVAGLQRLEHGGYFRGQQTDNADAFGILALRAAGVAAPPAMLRQLARDAAPGGGWDYVPDATATPDMTAAVIEALRAAGYGCSYRPIRSGLWLLGRMRSGDGGFAASAGAASNTQSTAWAVQAFAACRRDDTRGVRFLIAHQQPSGAVSYGPAGPALSTVWPTEQALAALAGVPLR
jgi:hypothetical protein